MFWHLFSSKLAWFYLGVVALAWALGQWVGEKSLLTLLLAYTPAVYWVYPAPFVLLWVWRKKRGLAAALLATVFVLWGAEILHFKPQQPSPLKVVSFNIAQGRSLKLSGLVDTLKKTDADVILLQESNGPFLRLRDSLVAAFPKYSVSHALETTTLSRLPLVSVDRVMLPKIKREVLITRLSWKGQPLTVVNTHLGTVQVLDILKGDFAYSNRTRLARAEQVAVLKQVAQNEKGRIILGGDFNTPPRGRIYRELQQAYGKDAFAEAGRGAGWTFPSLKLRIDHFMARGLTPTKSVVLPRAGSDHLPLMVEYK